MKTRIVLIITLCFSMSAWKCDRTHDLSSTPGAQVESGPIDAAPAFSACTLEVAVDVTTSEDDGATRSLLDKADAVYLNPHICRIAVLRLGEKGESVWTTRASSFDLAPIPMDEFDLSAAQKSLSSRCAAARECKEKQLKQLREEFDRKKADRMSAALVSRKATIKQAIDLATAIPVGIAPCSDIVSFADRIIKDGFAKWLLVTDGLHDCKTPIEQRSFPSGVVGIILQVNTKVASDSRSFGKRTSLLERIFQGEKISILPAVSVSESTFSPITE